MSKKVRNKENAVNEAAQKPDVDAQGVSETSQKMNGGKDDHPSEQDAPASQVNEAMPEEELSEEEKLKEQVAELEDKLLRTAADFDNYRKRMARQFEDVLRTANDRILMELLEVADNFERALHHSNSESKRADVEALHKGMELISNQLSNFLEKYDITPIEAVGQTFDPNLHEALMQVESDEYPEGVVAVEVTKGYRQGERVLRHSKVGVSKGKGEKEDKDEEV